MDPHQQPIAWLDSLAEAELACSRLEAEGIACRVVDSGVLGTGWRQPGQGGGIAIATSTEDAEEARALLTALDRDYRPELPAALGDEVRCVPCPECGSGDKDFARERPVEVVFRLLFPAHARAVTGPHWRCRACGHRWPVGNE